MSIDLDRIKKIRDERLDELQALERKLHSSKVQLFWEQNGTDAEKEEFISERNDIVLARVKLENTILDQIAGRLKELEGSLKEGIDNLKQEIENLNDTVNFLSTISRITGILGRILLLV